LGMSAVAGLGVGRDGSDEHNVTMIDEIAREGSDASDVFIAVGSGEAEIAADGLAKLFGIQHADAIAPCTQLRLNRAEEGGFARGTQASEPEEETVRVVHCSNSCPSRYER